LNNSVVSFILRYFNPSAAKKMKKIEINYKLTLFQRLY